MKHLMKKLCLLYLSILLVIPSFSQTITKSLESFSMNTSREIKIRLPKSYKKKVEKKYPLILTLDGDYLFDPLVGNVKYFSYWDDMPESIVVPYSKVQNYYGT